MASLRTISGRAHGAMLLHEREAELAPEWSDADDDDPQCDCELCRSYYLFSVPKTMGSRSSRASKPRLIRPELVHLDNAGGVPGRQRLGGMLNYCRDAARVVNVSGSAEWLPAVAS